MIAIQLITPIKGAHVAIVWDDACSYAHESNRKSGRMLEQAVAANVYDDTLASHASTSRLSPTALWRIADCPAAGTVTFRLPYKTTRSIDDAKKRG
jgi:hypothetical protein